MRVIDEVWGTYEGGQACAVAGHALGMLHPSYAHGTPQASQVAAKSRHAPGHAAPIVCSCRPPTVRAGTRGWRDQPYAAPVEGRGGGRWWMEGGCVVCGMRWQGGRVEGGGWVVRRGGLWRCVCGLRTSSPRVDASHCTLSVTSQNIASNDSGLNGSESCDSYSSKSPFPVALRFQHLKSGRSHIRCEVEREG
jgi:hypothetical protein